MSRRHREQLPTLYHGTSRPSWRRKRARPSFLYLASDLGDAWNYAYEQAARDEESGRSPEPIVLEVDLADLTELEFHPDHGGVDGDRARGMPVDYDLPWRESLRRYGGMSVRGLIDQHKRRFRPAPPDPNP